MEDGKPINGKVDISLFLHDKNEEFPAPRNVLVKYVFPNDAYDGGSSSDEVETFEIRDIESAEIFDRSEVVSHLGEKEVEKILQVVEALRKSLMSGDYKKAIDLQKFKIEEDARLEGLDVNELLKAAEEGYQLIGNEKNLRSTPLNRENVLIESVWGGRMFMVARKNGDEALAIESDELSFAIPIYVSKISGEWTIVR